MPHTLTKTALGLALGFLLINPASALILDPPANFGGSFSADNDVEQFQFSIASPSLVTIETISYSGGFEAPNPAIFDPGGGFDPVLSLFDGGGAFITQSDDVNFPFSLDAFIETPLDAGTYTVAVTQFGNGFVGGVGDDISLGFDILGILLPVADPAFFTNVFACTNGQFCDVFQDNRSSFFNVNVTAQALAVPEPSTLALLGFGLVGAGLAYRRRQQN